MKLKNENYFLINGWMINELKLKGATLLIYAIIYGFSQDEESEFRGSRQYLSDFTCSSKPTVDKALNDLCNSNLIIKITNKINNVVFNSYKANYDIVKNFTTGKETLPPPSKETLPNNKNNINKNDSKKESIIKNNTKEKKFFENIEVNNLFIDFLEMRERIKKPATDTAITLLVDKLNKQENDDIRKRMLEKSIVNCWQGLFELSRDEKDKLEREKWDNLPEEEKQAELDKLMKEFEDL